MKQQKKFFLDRNKNGFEIFNYVAINFDASIKT